MVPLPDELAVPFTRWVNDSATTAPLDTLVTIEGLRAMLNDAEALATAAARAKGVTWQTIADTLNVHKSTAHYRLGHVDPGPRRR